MILLQSLLSLPNNAYAYFALFRSSTKVQPKNVSQYPPKSQTMNTTCLTLILVFMLVANATASLTFPQTIEKSWTLLRNPSEPIIIHCESKVNTVAITMTEEQKTGWTLNVGMTQGCRMQEFSTRKATGEERGTPSLVELPLPIETEKTFANVSFLVLIPNTPHTLVAAWY